MRQKRTCSKAKYSFKSFLTNGGTLPYIFHGHFLFDSGGMAPPGILNGAGSMWWNFPRRQKGVITVSTTD